MSLNVKSDISAHLEPFDGYLKWNVFVAGDVFVFGQDDMSGQTIPGHLVFADVQIYGLDSSEIYNYSMMFINTYMGFRFY